jgi:hypothetical protein
MFDAYCPAHGANVLLTARRILAIDGAADRRTIRARCWCGALAVAEIRRAVPA